MFSRLIHDCISQQNFIHKHSQGLVFSSLCLCHCFSVSGGTVQGLISDFMGKRAPVLAVSLALAMGALVGYSREYRADKLINR